MRFGLFCKSFRDDVARFTKLVDSAERHNRDGFPFFVSVPRADLGLFTDRIGKTRVTWIADEELVPDPPRQGWIQQQLVKLEFYRTNAADAWFWVDSDCYFIRDFGRKDFVREDGSVAIAMSRIKHAFDENWDVLLRFLDDEGAIAPLTPDELTNHVHGGLVDIGWQTRLRDALFKTGYDDRIARVPAFFGRRGPHAFPLHGAIWTADSLRTFVAELLEPRKLTFQSILDYAPWEANWIVEWELHRKLPGRHVVQAPLAHMRLDETIRRARTEGLTTSRLAKRYLGVALAARHGDLDAL